LFLIGFPVERRQLKRPYGSNKSFKSLNWFILKLIRGLGCFYIEAVRVSLYVNILYVPQTTLRENLISKWEMA